MSFTRIDIAVKPPPEIIAEAIRLSTVISNQAETYFTLDNTSFFPHITLYATEYPQENLPRIIQTLQGVTSLTPTFTAEPTITNTHLGYIDVTLKLSDSWKNLHEKIVQSLNPIREGHLREKYISPTSTRIYASLQKEYIQTFGSPEVMTLYRPHLTLTRLKDEHVDESFFKRLKLTLSPFTVSELGVYGMGENGTCTNILQAIPLLRTT